MGRNLACLMIILGLSACEQIGIPDPQKQAEAEQAEGRAIGSACRHAGRALEDCFALNPEAHKAAVFEGWRTMNDYMTENNIEAVKPTIPPKMPAEEKPAEPEKHAEADAHEEAPPPETPLSRLRNRNRPGDAH